MENATKGLMIAGAILIAIVLIGIGVFLISQAQGIVDKVPGVMDQTAIDSFNKPFENYDGKQNGSAIKQLISTVNTNNLTAMSEGTSAEKGIDVIFADDVKAQGSTTKVGEILGNSDKSDFKYDSNSASKARNAINTGKTYYVSIQYDNTTKLIRTIGIALKDQATADALLTK